MRPLKLTLAVIGTFQLVLGLVFLVAPGPRRRSTGDEIATSTLQPDSLGAAR